MSIKESALSAITSISNSDFVRAVTSAGASRKITVANLAKAIVESYTGTSLIATNQSIKSAIDALGLMSNVTTNIVTAEGVSATRKMTSKVGRTVSSDFFFAIDSSFSGTQIASGLPVPITTLDVFIINLGANTIYPAYISTSGVLTARGSLPTGQYSAQFTYFS